jgi:hypothetical protein
MPYCLVNLKIQVICALFKEVSHNLSGAVNNDFAGCNPWFIALSKVHDVTLHNQEVLMDPPAM